MSKSESSSHRPCECGLWRYREGQSEVSTGCHRQVTGSRKFAQGHDAVLKGLLIRAGIAGVYVNRLDKSFDPTSAADQFGFSHQVMAGVAAGKARAEAVKARQLKAAAKRHAKAKSAPATPAALEVKVGRWFYPVVGELDGRVTYRDKAGETRMAPAGAQTRSV